MPRVRLARREDFNLCYGAVEHTAFDSAGVRAKGAEFKLGLSVGHQTTLREPRRTANPCGLLLSSREDRDERALIAAYIHL